VEKDTTEPTLGIEKVYERGPVKISLRLDKESPTIADKVSLELELVSEEDYTITAPTFEKKIGEFEIVDTSSSLPELTPEGKLRQTQSYILEPFLSGEYTIPSMRFAFQNTQTKENHEIETEPLIILVSSIATDVQNLTLHDIELPVDLPKPKKKAAEETNPCS